MAFCFGEHLDKRQARFGLWIVQVLGGDARVGLRVRVSGVGRLLYELLMFGFSPPGVPSLCCLERAAALGLPHCRLGQ